MTAFSMKITHYSMRTTLALIILTMGILGMAYAVYTGELYHNLTLANQREAFQKLIEQQTEELLADVNTKAERLGLSLQASEQFRAAFSTHQREDIKNVLGQHFSSYFVTTGALDVTRLKVYDPQLNLLAAYPGEDTEPEAQNDLCQTLPHTAAARSGAEKFKPMGNVCLTDDKPYVSVLVPIGTLRLMGYMQLIVDPINAMQQIENDLGFPLILRYPNARIAYKSPRWPSGDALQDRLASQYTLTDFATKPALHISMAYDVAGLNGKLSQTRTLVLLHATVTTCIAIVLSLLLLQKTAINPLKKLTSQLRLLREDRSHLGEKVMVEGDAEICSLADGFNDMTCELKDLYATLEKMAFTDTLTQLPNRSLFFDRLSQSVLLNRRHSAPFAVFVMDIDRFKLINDILGHNIGDIILQETSERLKKVIRETDTIARLGGDEFAALLPRVTDVSGANIVVKRISAALNKPVSVKGHNLKVGVSIGIVMHPHHGDDGNELLQRAEVAMYHAKDHQQGHAFYSPDIDPHSIHELTLETELKDAIEKDELQLHYQPKIELGTRRVYGVEALVRWTHPERGFIPPDSFIPMAEQTGLIHPLTQRVLRRALTQGARWQRNGIDLNVAVNLSAHSLRDANLTEMVQEELRQAGINPNSLTLEITESAVMADPKLALATLTKLDEMGVRMSVDDFGTGYSSLAYLKRLPVDEIKIDRSFVMEMDKDKNDEVIVRSTIDLAHNMGLKVVAEGIENETAWDMLSELGCDLGQGYFMCRPCDAQTLEEWLNSSAWKLYERDGAEQEQPPDTLSNTTA